MKLDVTFSLLEFAQLMREAAAKIYPKAEIGNITVESYDKPRIVIWAGDNPKIEAEGFAHRARE